MYNTFNGYMQGAQPYGNPYADRLAAMQQSQAMQQRCEVVTVNGENGAQAYADLHELGEVAAACEVKRLVESVACELERVESQRINLECLDYDLAAICAEQDRLLTRYSPNYGVVTA